MAIMRITNFVGEGGGLAYCGQYILIRTQFPVNFFFCMDPLTNAKVLRSISRYL